MNKYEYVFRLERFVQSMTSLREIQDYRFPVKRPCDNTVYFMEYFCSVDRGFRKLVNSRSCGHLITPLCYMECFAEYIGFSSIHKMKHVFYMSRELFSDFYDARHFIDAMASGGDTIMVKNFMFDTMELPRKTIVYQWTRVLDSWKYPRYIN